MFVNVGAYVGEGTMIDSHALVGSCAQIGRNCHISAGSQIGGVLEPVGALPVIIEDDVLVGGNSGVYEGTVVKRRAVLGTGDDSESLDSGLRSGARRGLHTATDDDCRWSFQRKPSSCLDRAPCRIPFGKMHGLSAAGAVIVKYRDAKTDSRIQLEDLLR